MPTHFRSSCEIFTYKERMGLCVRKSLAKPGFDGAKRFFCCHFISAVLLLQIFCDQ